MSAPLLDIRSMTTRLRIQGSLRPVLDDVELSISHGEVLGLVGESGSGKSMTARSLLRLLPKGSQCTGEVVFDGCNVLQMSRSELRHLRAHRIGIIFQDPRAHIDPLWRVGDYLGEGLHVHKRLGRRAARDRSIELLEALGIQDAPRVLTAYPGELSGGMLQRVMIAGALSCDPDLIIADEATTALDATVQSDILAILHDLRETRGLAVLFITHDLGLASTICDRVAVMYAGRVLATQPVGELFTAPNHPYSAALVQARPAISHSQELLPVVPGRPVSALEAPGGCVFHTRCPYAQPVCSQGRPALVESGPGAKSACVRLPELAAELSRKAQSYAG